MFGIFPVFCLNHLLPGWIQLFLQAPINLVIYHGSNKIVLIINLLLPHRTTRYLLAATKLPKHSDLNL